MKASDIKIGGEYGYAWYTSRGITDLGRLTYFKVTGVDEAPLTYRGYSRAPKKGTFYKGISDDGTVMRQVSSRNIIAPWDEVKEHKQQQQRWAREQKQTDHENRMKREALFQPVWDTFIAAGLGDRTYDHLYDPRAPEGGTSFPVPFSGEVLMKGKKIEVTLEEMHAIIMAAKGEK